MKRACLIAFCIVSAGLARAQPADRQALHFDLSKIGMAINGRQMCEGCFKLRASK